MPQEAGEYAAAHYYSKAIQLSALILAVAGIAAAIWRFRQASAQGATTADAFWLGATTVLLGLGALIAVRLAQQGRSQAGAYLFLTLYSLTLFLNAYLGPAEAAQLFYLGLPVPAILYAVGGRRAGALSTLLYGIPAVLLLFAAGSPLLPFLLSLLGVSVVSWLLLAAQEQALASARQAQTLAVEQAAANAQRAAQAETRAAEAVRVAGEATHRAAVVAQAGEAVERAASEALLREGDLSARLATALDEVRSLEQLTAEQRRNQPVEQLAAALEGARTPAMIAGRAARVFVEQLDLERCEVLRAPAEDGAAPVVIAAHSSAADAPSAPSNGEGTAPITLPLFTGGRGRDYGVLRLYGRVGRPPSTDDEQATARAMAARLASALQPMHKASAARDATARAALLGRMTDIAMAAPDELALYRRARRELFALFNATAFGVLLWQPRRTELQWRYAYAGAEVALPDPPPRPGAWLTQVARAGRPVQLSDSPALREDDSAGGLAGRSVACRLAVPLVEGGPDGAGGLLVLEHESDPQALTGDELPWLASLAGPLAAGIHNLRLLAELKESLTVQGRQQEQLAAAAALAAVEHERRLAESEDRVRQQQLVNELSARLHRAADVDAILGIALQALSARLGGRVVEAGLGETAVAGAAAMNEPWSSPGQPVYARYTDGRPAIHRGSRPANVLPPDSPTFPLSAGHIVLGEVTIAAGDPLSPAEEQFTRDLLREMAAALQNARHTQAAQIRASQLQAAVDVSRAISGYLDYDALTSQVAHLIRRRFGFYFVALFAVDGDRAHMLSGDGEPLPELPAPFILPLEEHTLLGRAAAGATPQPGSSQDIADPLPPALRDARSRLVLPLRARSSLQGLLDIYSGRENAFGPGEIAVLQGLAGQVAIALDNAQLFLRLQDSYLANARLVDETREHLAEFRLLFAVSQAASSSADVEQRLGFIARALHDGLRRATVAIFGLGQNGDDLRLLATQGDLPLAGSVDVAMLPNAATPSPEEEGADAGPRVLTPLRLGDRVVGLLVAQLAEKDRFSQREARLLETLGPSLAATIETGRIIAGIEAANARLQELDGLRTRFLANMSHEFRAPLNAIIGFARVLLRGIDGPLNNLQDEDLRAIEQNAQHLLLLINDVLDMAKIEAGRIELFLEEVDVGELVAGLAPTVRGLLAGKPVEFQLETAPSLSPIEADATRLRQIMLNLLSNAARYTEQGRILCRLSRPEADQLLIEVRDSGVGIPPEEQATLFQPFVQTESSLRAGQGTGLGLPITRHLVELHGGEIWFESEAGAGSTFYVRLPLRRPADPAAL